MPGLQRGALNDSVAAAADQYSRNLYLEGALLHARNLIEILADSRSGNDYMKPDDFAPGWDTAHWSHLKRQLDPLNEHLSHLSWKRLDPAALPPSATVFRDILEAGEAFRAHLADGPNVGGTPLADTLRRVTALAAPRIVARSGHPGAEQVIARVDGNLNCRPITSSLGRVRSERPETASHM